MSNPVEIVAKAIVDAMCKRGAGKEEVARAVIAALEMAGYRVVAREPTVEMCKAAFTAWEDDDIGAELIAAHAAAPTWGTGE